MDSCSPACSRRAVTISSTRCALARATPSSPARSERCGLRARIATRSCAPRPAARGAGSRCTRWAAELAMRKLASFEDPERARALSETLYAARIDSDVRQDGSVWVLSENDVPKAEAVLREFTARSGGHADQLRRLTQNVRTHPVTYVLFAICVLVWLVTEVLDHPEL